METGSVQQFPSGKASQVAWPNSEDSIDRRCGEADGLPCWTVKGLAEQVFVSLSPKIKEVLHRIRAPVSNIEYITFDMFMIGRTTEDAIPHIMFSCKNSTLRKTALDQLKLSGIILEAHPAIRTGQWNHAPHFPNVSHLIVSGYQPNTTLITPVVSQISAYQDSQQCSPHGFESPQLMEHDRLISNDRMQLESNTIYGANCLQMSVFKSSTCSSCVLLQLSFQDANKFTRQATAGALVRLRSKTSILVPNFVLSADDTDLSGEPTVDLSTVSRANERKFGGFDESHSRMDVRSDGDVSFSSKLDLLGPRSFPRPMVRSFELDYALLEVQDGDEAFARLPILSRHDVSPINMESAHVIVATGSNGDIAGRLWGRKTQIRLPYSDTYQDAYVCELYGSLGMGDCGSIVRDRESSLMYGHVVIGSPVSRLAYVIPAVNVVQDLERHLRSSDLMHPGVNEHPQDIPSDIPYQDTTGNLFALAIPRVNPSQSEQNAPLTLPFDADEYVEQSCQMLNDRGDLVVPQNHANTSHRNVDLCCGRRFRNAS